MKHGHPEFYKLLEKMADLHSRKNRNYAKDEDPLSNLRMCEDLGINAYKGCFIRIQDKYSRMVELLKGKPDLVGESIIDTAMDLAVYSLLFIILWEEMGDKWNYE